MFYLTARVVLTNSVTFLRRLFPVLLLMLLPCGLSTTGCCSVADLPLEPEVVVVYGQEIEENEDGTYTVTAGWMLRRLETEQALEAALDRCEHSE